MFGKRCSTCGEKTSRKHVFCPYCGNTLYKEAVEEDFGFFGKEDIKPMKKSKLPFESLFNSLLSELDKQLNVLNKEISQQPVQREMREKKSNEKIKQEVSGVSISITTANNRPEIQIQSFGTKPAGKEKILAVQPKFHGVFDNEKIKQMAKLPKEEASLSVRRLANKVIYEVNIPGVNSIKDVSILQLENSIEIHAMAKDKAYVKVIPVSFPLHRYGLQDDKLIIELHAG